MATATRIWTATEVTNVAQVDKITVGGTWTATHVYTITMTTEGDVDVSVSTTAGSATASTIRDNIVTKLNAQSAEPYSEVTWAASATSTLVVKGTAKLAGRPFYVTATEASSSGTLVRAAVTANVGRNDFNTAVCWKTATGGSGVPTTSDIIRCSQGDHDIMYGLPQSSRASALSVQQFRRGRGYFGTIGDPARSYYLEVDADSGGQKEVHDNGGGGDFWLKGTHPKIYRSGGGDGRAHFDTDCDNYYAGGGASGEVHFADSSVLDNVYQYGTANGFITAIGQDVTSLDKIEGNSGRIQTKSTATTCTIETSGRLHLVTLKECDEGTASCTVKDSSTMEFNGSGTITKINLKGGFSDLSRNQSASVTITNMEAWAGRHNDKSGLRNVTYSNAIVNHAGAGTIESESGVSISYA